MVDKDEVTGQDVTELGADTSMADDSNIEGEIEDMDSMKDLYEQSFRNIQEGEVIRGRIVQISDDYVMVDIGYKSEGQISVHEFKDEKGVVQAAIGDDVDVLLEFHDDEDGTIHLSKEKAAKIKVWDDISRIYNEDGIIEGKVVSKVKGGLAVDIGVQAFLPGSQVDLRPVRNLEFLIGQTFPFKVLKYNKKRRNVVLSRRALLEKEREQMKSQTLANLEDGKVVEGIVKNITDYGVFVDLGGIDGLLHITDMSWGRVGHPSELFQIGDRIKVMVLSFDRDHERVSLGLKQLVADPWTRAESKYPIGTRVNGRVVSLTDYGAFVEIEEGVEGLIHVSEMSWTKKVRHPSKVLNVGDEVEAVVLSINPENKRISLGMKQLEPNPWDIIAQKYPVGTTIAGKIKNITDFGVFIGIDEGIDGLVHISDISWTKRVKHPSEVFRKNQEVQAIVLNIDKDNERFSLGIKQLEPDPWESIPERYPLGSVISGPITNVTDFGLFVELEEGIEGLVHVSEISKEKIKSPVGQYKTAERITAKVINISPKDRKIGLSIKKVEEQEERSNYDDYMNSAKAATSNLGELLKEELEAARANNPTPNDKS
ncbi:30S ribosomal protein S1 [Syntrophobacter fumaroxidans]|uniref:Small ribosomal subunit protein bS1 n=1 Tax=Syntrophobacter fumaroxidans (strain DSM 10017 / MPOB) TaxID=335543 RepID=A0LK49_SYNFM|nr:30S ribosomal protein S1 [Syntrophobacter fumaroxidans]ABK17801.1 SSU ribosomal protein S1P [Syntrophobacter fumaroxidans MPOB]